MKSFVMLGQSNMAGRGDFDVPLLTHPRAKMLRNGLWTAMGEPVNPDHAIFEGLYHSGVSLAPQFAVDFCEKFPEETCGLVPCAHGGTVIEQWQPGETLFENAVFQIKMAQKTSEVAGFLFHQGESNAHDGKFEHYEERFETFYEGLVRETGLKDVPFLIGELGEYLKDAYLPGRPNDIPKNFPYVNDILKRIVSRHPNFAFVPSTGLGCKPDKLHLHSAALREFGHRYFQAWLAITDQTAQ